MIRRAGNFVILPLFSLYFEQCTAGIGNVQKAQLSLGKADRTLVFEGKQIE